MLKIYIIIYKENIKNNNEKRNEMAKNRREKSIQNFRKHENSGKEKRRDRGKKIKGRTSRKP